MPGLFILAIIFFKAFPLPAPSSISHGHYSEFSWARSHGRDPKAWSSQACFLMDDPRLPPQDGNQGLVKLFTSWVGEPEPPQKSEHLLSGASLALFRTQAPLESLGRSSCGWQWDAHSDSFPSRWYRGDMSGSSWVDHWSTLPALDDGSYNQGCISKEGQDPGLLQVSMPYRIVWADPGASSDTLEPWGSLTILKPIYKLKKEVST